MNGGISATERALTHHVKIFIFQHFSNKSLRRLSFLASLAVCLLAGSVMTFSLFTDSFISQLQYTQLQVNLIGGSIAVGLYLFLPILGYLADLHGPVLLAALSMVLFCPSYLLAATVYTSRGHYLAMCLAFMLIGVATASLYFCSLLTCAKIYPNNKAISISGPVTAFGVSPVLITQFTKLDAFTKSGIPDPFRCFIGFTVLYCFLSMINWIASVVVTIEKEVVFESQTNYGATDQDEEHKRIFNEFLTHPTTYMLLVAFFFLAGPMEMYITNMGNLAKVVGTASAPISKQVSIFSICSTLTRLSVGCLSDFLESRQSLKDRYPTMWLLLLMSVPGMFGFGFIATNRPCFTVITAFIGTSYGAVFSLFPTIVASRWGVENLGSTWGMFMVAPATGSVLAGTAYALQYNHSCVATLSGSWNYCLTLPFGAMTAGFALAICLLLVSWKLFCRPPYISIA